MSMQDVIAFIAANWPTALALSAIVLFTPFEILFPRVRSGQNWRQRVPAIALLGLLTLVTSYGLIAFAQAPYISAIVKFKVFSIAKLPLPDWAILLGSVLLIDLLSYGFHRLSHVVWPLWRLHAVHHADEHVTALTGQLHHPLEAAVQYFVTMFAYVVFGVPIVAVAVYALVAGVHNAFTHADVALPRWVDLALRSVIVTPDMHRIHHSVDLKEGNSNFSQVFSVWDRIFGTYVPRPTSPPDQLRMGLPDQGKPRRFDALSLILLPIRRG